MTKSHRKWSISSTLIRAIQAQKDEYRHYLELVLLNIRPWVWLSLMTTLRYTMRISDYLEFAFNTLLHSVDIPLDDGIILSYRTEV